MSTIEQSHIERIKNTEAYKASGTQMPIQLSMVGVIVDALAYIGGGFSYDQWINTTGCGKLAKAIVKEIVESNQTA